MRLKVAAVFVLLGCLVGVANAAGTIQRVRVWADCSGDDLLGGQLCSALKEKIRGSKGFELAGQGIAEHNPGSIGVHIVSIGIHESGEKSSIRSAVSFVLTFPAPDHTELFITSSVAVIGSQGLNDLAESIFAKIERVTETFQKK
jgi:hypothetical protein